MKNLTDSGSAAGLTNRAIAENDSRLPCWKAVGVWGARTCEQLTQVNHCYDCSIYSSAGAQLLQRAIPADYAAQQTLQQAVRPSHQNQSQRHSMLIFRLQKEWLALPARLCQQILSPLAPHRLPHRSNATLLGIVNIHGQLLLKVSLLNILNLNAALAALYEPDASLTEPSLREQSLTEQKEEKAYRRMIVIKAVTTAGVADTWVFDVDELYGLYSAADSQLEPAAAGMTAVGQGGCTRSVFSWRERRVSVLDDVRLFEALRQQAL